MIFQSKITITTAADPVNSRCYRLLQMLACALGIFCNTATASETNSFGFLFDHFNLTLEAGQRTEAAGPFYYSQKTEDENIFAFPPFFSKVGNPSVAYTNRDFLYPLLTRVQYGQEWRWQLFQLLSFSGGQEPTAADKTRHTIFPFYFSQRSKTDTNLDSDR